MFKEMWRILKRKKKAAREGCPHSNNKKKLHDGYNSNFSWTRQWGEITRRSSKLNSKEKQDSFAFERAWEEVTAIKVDKKLAKMT